MPRFSFSGLLALTMLLSTLAPVVFAVLGKNLIDEFGVERWQLGALVSFATLGGALVARKAGSLVDRFGGRAGALATISLTGLGVAGMALSPSFALLALAAVVHGLSQGIANPATNHLISDMVPAGRRGLITGIKQSGVQAGTFLGGLLLPPLARVWGWRGAVASALAPAVIGLVGAVRLPARAGEPSSSPPPALRVDPFIRRLAAYGFLLGMAGTAVFTYMPLFAQERLGLTAQAAGAALALSGGVSVLARILLGRQAERSGRFARYLALLAIGSALSTAGFLLGSAVWLWPAAVGIGLTASSWNSVGMQAVISTVPLESAGRASGTVLAGFLVGLTAGAPLFGWSVDRTNSYTAGWLTVSGLFLLAAVVITRKQSPSTR